MIYLDNAATTWPKPEGVLAAMHHSIAEAGANPGRGGHDLAIQAGRLIYNTREKVAALFGLSDPLQVVFTANATEALNTILFGLLEPGDHVVTSSLEHNAVARPLHQLSKRGVTATAVATDPRDGLEPQKVREAILPNTRLLVFTHASNVFGTLLPIHELARIATAAGVPILVDAAQTAGVMPIDMTGMGVDYLAAPGHKGLYGPQGTGVLCINSQRTIRPLRFGGTGSRSESLEQPEMLPDLLESGTPNTPGIAGLGAGLDYLQTRGLEPLYLHENALIERLHAGLLEIPGVAVYGPGRGNKRAAVLSFNIGKVDSASVAHRLDRRYGIAVRAGLHCAPWAHQSAGTLEQGTVRVSVGDFNTAAEIDHLITAVEQLSVEME